MDYEKARKLVISDQLNSSPSDYWTADPAEGEALEVEVIAHVHSTLSLEDPAPIGAVTFTDYGDEMTEAYRVVISQKRTL